MTTHEHSRNDAAAYALGALDPPEADEFRRHMSECVVCREEVAAFRNAVNALPAAAPQYRAPKQLRRKVMHAVREGAEPKTLRLPALGLRTGAIMTAAATAFAAAIAIAVLSLSGGSSNTRIVAATVGDAEVRLTGSHAELVVRHLPSPPAGHIYELWVRHGDRPPEPTSTLFSVTTRGTADIGVPGGIHGVSAVLVTAEPAGGTKTPTTTPVIVTQLS